MNDVRPTVDFDHYDEALARDPYPVLRQLREECPVAHSPAHGGFWVVSRYEDIAEMLRRPEMFSSRHVHIPADIGFGDVSMPPVELDPPDHTRLRRLLASAFVPVRIAEYEAAIRKTVVDLIDGFATTGHCDGAQDFARVIPTATMCQFLGLEAEYDRFTDWIERIMKFAPSDPSITVAAAFEVVQFFAEVVEARREQPGSDVISLLIDAEFDGERLTEFEIILSCTLFLFAGVDTTWGVLASALLHLARHPEEQERLRRHPELLPTAREEFLRAYSPVTVARQVKADVDFRGCPLQADEMVLVSLPSANRDDAAFEHADEVILDRQPNPHIAFGSGAHKCLGASLARLELTVALEEFLGRLPTFRVADEDAVSWPAGPIHGPRRLPLRFEPA